VMIVEFGRWLRDVVQKSSVYIINNVGFKIMNELLIKRIDPVEKYDILTFELLVDGRPLSDHLNDGNAGIPYWMTKDGIPHLPPSDATSSRYIVTVCDCGEYGCGNSSCEILRKDNIVEFFHFLGDCGAACENLKFTFLAQNYDAQIENMKKEANKALEAMS